MHDHRVHADLLEQGDIAAEHVGEMLFAHGVTAVLHDDGSPGIAAQERQRMGEDLGLLGRGLARRLLEIVDSVGHLGVPSSLGLAVLLC